MTKKLTAIILSLLIMLICSAAYADASLDAQADKAQVSAGDTVTVTITLKGDKLAAAEGSFAYDTSLLSFEEAEGGAGDGYISMVFPFKGRRKQPERAHNVQGACRGQRGGSLQHNKDTQLQRQGAWRGGAESFRYNTARA